MLVYLNYNLVEMLDGWYCRSIANMQAAESGSGGNTAAVSRASNSREDYSSESSSEGETEPNYRARYLNLKKKLKYLIFVCTTNLFYCTFALL